MYRIFLTGIMVFAILFAGDCHAQNAEQQKVSGQTAFIKGMVAFENEEYENAIQLFSDAFTKLPNSSGLTFALADAYLKIGDLSNASYYAGQAVDMEPTNKWYRLKLAEIYRLTGQNALASEQYQAVLRNNPDDRQALSLLAHSHEADNQLLEANKVYDKMLNGSDADIPIRLKKAENFWQLEMKDSVRSELQQIQMLNPREPAVFQKLGDMYLELDSINEAERILQKALEKDRRDAQTRVKLAEIYIAQDNWNKGQTILQKVLADSSMSPEDKLPVARYILSKYNAEPSNAQIVDVTTNLLNTFTEAEPNHATAHSLAARFFVQTDQPQKALQALARTTQLQPLDDEAWKQRLQLLISQKNFQQVTDIAPQAEENIPQDPFILYFIGTAHLELNNFELAANKLNEATNYPARRNFKSQIYTALGKAQAGQSEWEEAAATFEQALKADQNNAEAMEHLGNVFDRLGKKEAAKEWWQKALEKDPGRSHLKQKILQ